MISVLTSGQVSKKTSEQVNELIVLLTFFCRSYKSAFSHHDNVRASSTQFIWLNENVHLSWFDINTPMLTQGHKKHNEVLFTFSSLYAAGKIFSTCKACVESSPARSPFQGISTFLPQTNAVEFQNLSYLCLILRIWEECLSWYCITSTINSSQLIERLKVKTTP